MIADFDFTRNRGIDLVANLAGGIDQVFAGLDERFFPRPKNRRQLLLRAGPPDMEGLALINFRLLELAEAALEVNLRQVTLTVDGADRIEQEQGPSNDQRGRDGAEKNRPLLPPRRGADQKPG